MFLSLFLPRDAMHSADYAVARCLSICPSVCPSLTRPYWVKTAEHILKLFHCRVTTLFYFFRTKRYGNIPTGTPGRGVECKGAMKNRDCRPISRIYLGNDTRGMRIRNRRQAFKWYHFQWPWTIRNPDFNVTPLLYMTLNISETVGDTVIQT